MSAFANSEDPDENAAFHHGLLCKGKKDFQTKEYNFFNDNLTTLDIYTGLSQVYCIKPEGRIQ